MSIIQIQHLYKTFGTGENAVHALEDISLDIQKGEIFGIIGLSGAGKSTLVRCMNLLERPTSGTVIVDGKDMTALSEKELRLARRNVTMIFQSFNLLMQRTVLKNVCFPMELSGTPAAQARKRALELLDLAAIPGFPDLGTDTISSLTWESGGTTLTLTKTETETAGAESGDSSSSESAEETEPAWDVNGTAIPSDNSAFTSLMAQLSSLAFDACYDYKGEADTLAACGLDTPVGVLTVTHGEGETLTLTIGALDGTGDSYYAQLSGDPAVYLLSADSVDSLISLSAQELTAAEEDETETASDASSSSTS